MSADPSDPPQIGPKYRHLILDDPGLTAEEAENGWRYVVTLAVCVCVLACLAFGIGPELFGSRNKGN